jgi:hypothetical protein
VGSIELSVHILITPSCLCLGAVAPGPPYVDECLNDLRNSVQCKLHIIQHIDYTLSTV